MADAAKAELDLTYQQMQRAHRPVLVPFQRAEDVKFPEARSVPTPRT
jgi:hypothetical protein